MRVRSVIWPSLPNCGASYGPIITTSNWRPAADTSRVVTSRKVPLSRIV